MLARAPVGVKVARIAGGKDRRFHLRLTPDERADLIAFLRAL
jgi:hypothetical protein